MDVVSSTMLKAVVVSVATFVLAGTSAQGCTTGESRTTQGAPPSATSTRSWIPTASDDNPPGHDDALAVTGCRSLRSILAFRECRAGPSQRYAWTAAQASIRDLGPAIATAARSEGFLEHPWSVVE
jgi:hypothetical protein